MHPLTFFSAFMEKCVSITSISLVVTLTWVPSRRSVTCLQTKNSQRLATHFYGDLVHWKSRIATVPVFSSCQSDLTSGVSIHMVATNLTMRYLAWDLETNLLIFQYSFIFVIPICPDPAASCEATKHNKGDLSADMTKNVCRDDVHQENAHDCAPFLQGILSVSNSTVLRQDFLTQCYTLFT